jgi:predicted ATPase
MGSQTIDQIEIEGYKSIRNCRLELGALNLLIGANGAGKSNFVSAFSMLGSIVNRSLAVAVGKAGGSSALLRNGSSETQSLRFQAWFGKNQYEVSLTSAADDALIFESEVCYFHDKSKFSQPADYPLPPGGRESSLRTAVDERSGAPSVYQHCYDAMNSWKVFHFHDTGPTANVKKKHLIDDNKVLHSDAGNLAPFLLRLRAKNPGCYQQIVDQIRLVAPFFDDFVLEADGLNEDRLQLQWKHRTNDAFFNAHALSDGTLRFICLSTLLLQPSPPSVILIDEPELGLHPFAISQLAELVRSVSIDRQLILSTQSVSFLNHLDVEQVIVTEHTNGGSSFIRPDSNEMDNWLAEYSLGELWEKNVLGGRPR